MEYTNIRWAGTDITCAAHCCVRLRGLRRAVSSILVKGSYMAAVLEDVGVGGDVLKEVGGGGSLELGGAIWQGLDTTGDCGALIAGQEKCSLDSSRRMSGS